MLWRKRVIQILVYSVVIGLAGLFIAYQALTNPIATRQLILQSLASKFPGAQASLESARLNLFDGISASELRMARRDDLDRSDFLHVPSATIFMDKEQVLDGKVLLRKIVLNRPQIRVVIDRNGTCNLLGLLAPTSPGERIPTIVFKQASITIEDHRLGVGRPLLEIHDLQATLFNDPIPQLVIDCHGRTDVLGPIKFHAVIQREEGATTANLELSSLLLGGVLTQRIAEFAPDLAAHLRQFQANSTIEANLSWKPGNPSPLGLQLICHLLDGQVTHARLPFTLDRIEGLIKLVNDPPQSLGAPGETTPRFGSLVNLRVTEAKGTAQAGSSRFAGSIKDLKLGAIDGGGTASGTSGNSALRAFCNGDDDLPVSELIWLAEHLPVNPELFRYLPDTLQVLREDFKPCGPITVQHTYRRSRPGNWKKNYHMIPEGMEMEFVKFPYPLHTITGTINRDVSSEGGNHIQIDLAGYGGDQPLVLRGTIDGERETAGVDLHLEANDVPLDDRMHRALPPKSQHIATQFHPRGLADIRADIHRTQGKREFDNRYLITFHQASLNYDLFPIPLDNVSGILEVFHDHWECRNFKGQHLGGLIELAGRSYPAQIQEIPGGTAINVPEQISLAIQGTHVALNREFEEALSSPHTPGRTALTKTWKTLLPSGKLDFYAEVVDVQDHPKDLNVKVAIRSCNIKPKFFDYNLQSVSARVNYSHDQIDLTEIHAFHGPTHIYLPRGQIRLRGDDSLKVELPEVQAEKINPDQEFLDALPPPMKKGLACLKLNGLVNLKTSLEVDQKEGNQPASVRWDGVAQFMNNSLKASVEVKDLQGLISSQGMYDGQQISQLAGIMMVDKATVMGQPIQHFRANLQVQGDTPNTLRFYNVNSEFFGGHIGTEAQVSFGPQFAYSVHMIGTQIQLEQFGKHNLGTASDMTGPARFGLFLHGVGTETNEIEGDGTVDIPSGKLYRLPPLLDLLKAFGLRRPDQTAFEQAHLKFDVRGGKLHFSDLDLIGNAISLRGKGSLNLDGTNLMLDFNADWGRLNQLLPTQVQAIPQFFSDQLFMIKVRGKIGDMKFEKEIIPGVTEPIRKVINKSQ